MRLDHLLSREKINCCLVLKVQPSKRYCKLKEVKKIPKSEAKPFYKIVSDEFEAVEENLKEHIRICD